MARDMRWRQVTLTLALPYLVFIVGERVFEVSGVVAAVTAGLVMTAVGQPRFAPTMALPAGDVGSNWPSGQFNLIFIWLRCSCPGCWSTFGLHDLNSARVLAAAGTGRASGRVFGMLPMLSALR